ncbi:heavy-metal-associated domain-containing protein [Clostridium magnum]|uniref:Copper chaperone CopZ n=1 Tax=Clostridium magnum DSM 2767 TaxID=1121326 RepID=A0A162UL07_9CLOT|nr:heavy metal-associated domain-containing protein [Clostridium magnum]KZL94031.1 copper chaperone CopZ [Clostridium magnum DSM 2767]SHI00701.1 Copper chaperone CopZ [Clostridium magnum DSM 2767]
MKKILTIQGMSCMNCVKQVHDALMELPEVNSVNIDIRTDTVFLDVKGNVDNDKIKNVVDDTGYKVTDIQKV